MPEFGLALNTNLMFQHAHPYISAMVNNGSSHYDHDRDGTHTQLGGVGCTSKFRNKDFETSMLIRYVDDTISVSFSCMVRVSRIPFGHPQFKA